MTLYYVTLYYIILFYIILYYSILCTICFYAGYFARVHKDVQERVCPISTPPLGIIGNSAWVGSSSYKHVQGPSSFQRSSSIDLHYWLLPYGGLAHGGSISQDNLHSLPTCLSRTGSRAGLQRRIGLPASLSVKGLRNLWQRTIVL